MHYKYNNTAPHANSNHFFLSLSPVGDYICFSPQNNKSTCSVFKFSGDEKENCRNWNSIYSNTAAMADLEEDDVEYEPETIVVGPFSFSLMTISFMPLEKLLENQTKGVEISGQKVWCGSLVVAEYLLNNADYVRDKVIVELGSGTGLLGMLCKKLGASNVFLTDHDQRSINHMNSDTATNSIENTTVHKLDWFQLGQCDELLAVAPLCLSSSARIVAGDVLYKNVLLDPFFATVLRIFEEIKSVHNSSEGPYEGRMLLCHVPRAGVEQSDVIAAATNRGMNITIIDPQHWKKGSVVEFSIPEDYDRAQLYEFSL
jgi:predicted RNA methylase